MAAAVADHLRRPLVTQVAELPLDGGTVRAKRQAEHGYDLIEAPLPAVVSVSDAINTPRLPSIKAIMGAKRKPLETLSAADLELDAPRGRRRRAQRRALDLAPAAQVGGPADRGRGRRLRPRRSSRS